MRKNNVLSIPVPSEDEGEASFARALLTLVDTFGQPASYLMHWYSLYRVNHRTESRRVFRLR